MEKPDLTGGFELNGHVDVEWFDILDKADIPDLEWQQVYIIGDIEGKVPLVLYADAQDNLPGGRTESDESLEQTMTREVKEELNMRILSWQPLGFQKTVDSNGTVNNQFRAYAKLEKIGEFSGDIGGNVIGHKLVELIKVNEFIQYGPIGDRLIKNSQLHFGK